MICRCIISCYLSLNYQTKGDIIEARSTYDGILDDLLASYIICEVSIPSSFSTKQSVLCLVLSYLSYTILIILIIHHIIHNRTYHKSYLSYLILIIHHTPSYLSYIILIIHHHTYHTSNTLGGASSTNSITIREAAVYISSGKESERYAYEDSSVVQGCWHPTNQFKGLNW